MTDEVREAPQVAAIVERYIALRDRKAELKAAYDASVKDIDTAMARVEGFLLKTMQELGVESVRTPHGTPYISVKASASTADRAMLIQFAQDNGEWGALDIKPNKTFVEAYKNEHNDLPPGVNWREERVVNIRRS